MKRLCVVMILVMLMLPIGLAFSDILQVKAQGSQRSNLPTNAKKINGPVDLFVSKIDASNTNPQNNMLVGIQAEITNQGDVDRSVEWKFLNNGFPTGQGSSLIKEGTINIKKRSSGKVNVNVVFNKEDSLSGSGIFTTTFIVDPNNQIIETNEDNNLAGIIIRIKGDQAQASKQEIAKNINDIQESKMQEAQQEIEEQKNAIREEKENLEEGAFTLKINEQRELPIKDGNIIITLLAIDKTSRHNPSGLFRVQKNDLSGNLVRLSECLLNENDMGIFCASIPLEVYTVNDDTTMIAIGDQTPKHVDKISKETKQEERNQNTKIKKMGCKINTHGLLPIGSRIIKESKPYYCDASQILLLQKELDASASFKYECQSNMIQDGKCAEESNHSFMSSIVDFLNSLFQ